MNVSLKTVSNKNLTFIRGKLVAVGVVPFLHNWASRNKTNDAGHATQAWSVSASCRRATLPAPASTAQTYSLLPVVKLGRPLALQWHKLLWRLASLRLMASSQPWVLNGAVLFYAKYKTSDSDASFERKWLDCSLTMRREPENSSNSSVKLSARGVTCTWVLVVS